MAVNRMKSSEGDQKVQIGKIFVGDESKLGVTFKGRRKKHSKNQSEHPTEKSFHRYIRTRDEGICLHYLADSQKHFAFFSTFNVQQFGTRK